VKFIFYLYVGSNKSIEEPNASDGEMSTEILKEMIKDMYGKGYYSSNQAKSMVKNIFEGSLDLAEFEKYVAKYVCILFPALSFQKNLRYNANIIFSHIKISFIFFFSLIVLSLIIKASFWKNMWRKVLD
jgi:hypothetical protein